MGPLLLILVALARYQLESALTTKVLTFSGQTTVHSQCYDRQSSMIMISLSFHKRYDLAQQFCSWPPQLFPARQWQRPTCSSPRGGTQVDGPRLQRCAHCHCLAKAGLDWLPVDLEPRGSRWNRGLQVNDRQAIKECSSRIPPADLWKPDISLYNKQDLDHGILAADPRSANTNAHIHSNGNILWILPVSHKVMRVVGQLSQVVCLGVVWRGDLQQLAMGQADLQPEVWVVGSRLAQLRPPVLWRPGEKGKSLFLYKFPVQAEMDLRQFGEYNQFKILRQTATRESKRYYQNN